MPSKKESRVVIPETIEEVAVSKHRVAGAGYRISKTVGHRTDHVDQLLHGDQVEVETVVIGRLLPSMEAPPLRQEGNTTILSVVEEVLITEKRLRLKEEIHITVTSTTSHEKADVLLREEHVTIAPLDAK